MSEPEQLELLRSVLARAYEERQPLPLRLINTVMDHIVSRTPRADHRESQHYRRRSQLFVARLCR